ncbi:2-dehydro-3-deoxy-phosphogluconate aldolase [Kordia antarctica]|uniref:2-dehydro-3-deoxy-phosphogluconate aldolase n=1 Tax=Kordia antarctica TaxID=1218801 RepID=A0A7L4ZRA0_9FLAO|nr:bifunctional 4-hydroxy-2-oxoglutarate aldolase/2-dehydro-3-deoxy-phosphogluconate aldolase [Kordia antarctica]QHI39228.1 2-dehydro-3-deoxy-phosphogluconate aldolase [Kordia antarctica]
MTTTSNFSWELFNKVPIIGIVRNIPMETVKKIAQAYVNAGLTTIEITMNTKDADKIISYLRTNFPELNVGAGTVCTTEDYDKAVKSGAQFIVTPIIDEIVIKKAVQQNIPIFPGAFTPTEIYKAWSLGASAVKVFPATQLGATYIKDVLGPLNIIKLVPTGGVSKENIKSFFQAGATGVGMGSSLLNKKIIANNDFSALETYFKSIVAEIQ